MFNKIKRTIGNGECILFIDDEPLIVELICKFIESINYKITIAVSGEEALSLFNDNNNHFDCIITDYSMGNGMNGITFISEIRKHSNDIPIIIYSGYGEMIPSLQKLDLTNTFLLTKPATLSEISTLLKEVLS